MTGIMTSYEKQASTKQDYAFHGISDDKTFEYVGVADGHGSARSAGGHKDFVIDLLRSINWSKELQEPDFFQNLIKRTNIEKSNGCGSTLCVFKIYPDRFECTWVGDSSGKIYSEGKCVWRTTDHDRDNIKEIARVIKLPNKVPITHSWDIIVVDPTMIRSVRSKLFHFSPGNTINMPNSLGHVGLTGEHISTEIIPRVTFKQYNIVAGTDGLWAMTYDGDETMLSNPEMTSELIGPLIDQRWRQEWNHDNTHDITPGICFEEDNIDDVAIATWSDGVFEVNKPAQAPSASTEVARELQLMAAEDFCVVRLAESTPIQAYNAAKAVQLYNTKFDNLRIQVFDMGN